MRVDCLMTDGGWIDHTVYNLGVMVDGPEAVIVLERWFSATAADRHVWRFSRSDGLHLVKDIRLAEFTGDDKGARHWMVYPMLDGTRVLLEDNGVRYIIPASGLARMLGDVLGADESCERTEEEGA